MGESLRPQEAALLARTSFTNFHIFVSEDLFHDKSLGTCYIYIRPARQTLKNIFILFHFILQSIG